MSLQPPPRRQLGEAELTQARFHAASEAAGFGLHLGEGPLGPAFAPPEHSLLVLGPPRCGKTSSIVVGNVLAACGPVVSTSTKTDVLQLTSRARHNIGDCYLFDPSGLVPCPPGVHPIGWSPLLAASSWDGANRMAKAMVRAARPGADRGEAAHWSERAEDLLARAFHAGAVGAMGFERLLSVLESRDIAELRAPLARASKDRVLDGLDGFSKTDSREQSGIWSTAASVLSGYRTDAALATTRGVMIDPAEFVRSRATLFVCGGSDQQLLSAGAVAGLLSDLRSAAYESHLRDVSSIGRRTMPPMLLALDEVANIAPLHDLPHLVTEGGSQGVLTLACFQDLSQAAVRWPEAAGGFLTTFQSKVVFPGIGDTATLERISKLAGDREVRQISRTRTPAWTALFGVRQPPSTTVSTRTQRRLPLDAIARGAPGYVLHMDGVNPRFIAARPWFADGTLRRIVAPAVDRLPARSAHEAGTWRERAVRPDLGRSLP